MTRGEPDNCSSSASTRSPEPHNRLAIHQAATPLPPPAARNARPCCPPRRRSGHARNGSVPILPKERDPRLITVRRGGTLTGEHHRLLADWALLCAGHVLHLFEDLQPGDSRPREAIDIGRAWIRGEVRMGDAHRAAFRANAALPGPGPRNESRSGRICPPLSVNSFSTTSNAGAPSAGTSSTTDLKPATHPFLPPGVLEIGKTAGSCGGVWLLRLLVVCIRLVILSPGYGQLSHSPGIALIGSCQASVRPCRLVRPAGRWRRARRWWHRTAAGPSRCNVR